MFNRRTFLRGLGLAAAGAALGPAVARRALGAPQFKAKRVVVVGVAGGLRLRESLGMAEGATMPSLLGAVPLISGYGDKAAGKPNIAPEYVAAATQTPVVPAPRKKPLYAEGALITNLRYAEGSPGHLQGAATLVSGAYNDIDNRADAHAPAPTLFELHRRAANAPATDAWYLSVLPGFFRALLASDHPDYGARYGASWLAPQGMMTPVVPILASSKTKIDEKDPLPTIQNDAAARDAARKLAAVVDATTPPWDPAKGAFASIDDDARIEAHLAALYADPTYEALFPQSFGIGMSQQGRLSPTGDASTTYHAERVLERFKPTVVAVQLFDVDTAHSDFNGYLQNQTIADACVAHLWDFIQSTPGLKDETAMIVVPEHGRQLDFNGKMPDSLGRSGLDHGGGDDGDRDVFALLLGPDFKPGVIAPSGIQQTGRASGRYETIDAVMTAATLLGYGDAMKAGLADGGHRAGLVIQEALR